MGNVMRGRLRMQLQPLSLSALTAASTALLDRHTQGTARQPRDLEDDGRGHYCMDQEVNRLQDLRNFAAGQNCDRMDRIQIPEAGFLKTRQSTK